MDKIGRKQTMALGFFLWSILAFIIGGALNPITSVFPLFVVLYGIFNTLGEMGPGVCTSQIHNLSMLTVRLKFPRLALFSAELNPSRRPYEATSLALPLPLEKQVLRLGPKFLHPFKTLFLIRKREFRESSLSAPHLPWLVVLLRGS